ncbi:hypothetical protein N656DRAFT_599658 [Canariomyces notabilis]|uniref:Uncharacterized protein n=1 Tax=Canariomyces notabilis TaxID=2074819 RepID=A0AAN6YUS6_9PEZI|nr:hypothetical protein N656DRAFT_599658 [Canariomyces arenarius]
MSGAEKAGPGCMIPGDPSSYPSIVGSQGPGAALSRRTKICCGTKRSGTGERGGQGGRVIRRPSAASIRGRGNSKGGRDQRRATKWNGCGLGEIPGAVCDCVSQRWTVSDTTMRALGSEPLIGRQGSGAISPGIRSDTPGDRRGCKAGGKKAVSLAVA